MIGSWRWNAVCGAAVMFVTFVVSISRNPFAASLLGSVYAFIVAFAVMFAFRWLLGTAAGLKQFGDRTVRPDGGGGNSIDVISAPDEQVNELIKNRTDGRESGFTPLKPPKLATREKIDPQKMADSVRQLSEE